MFCSVDILLYSTSEGFILCAMCELAKQSIFSLISLNLFTRNFPSGCVCVDDMCGIWLILSGLTWILFVFLSSARVGFAVG